LIKKLDENKDGKIDFKEFSNLMNHLLQELISQRSSVKSLFGQSDRVSESSNTNKNNPKSRFSKDNNSKETNKITNVKRAITQ